MEIHFHRLDVKACARHLGMNPQRDSLIRLNPNHEHIEVVQIFVKQNRRRFFEMNGNFGCRLGKPFPHAHINGNVGPSPVVDEQTQGDESLGLRVCVDVFFLAIPQHGIAVNGAFSVLTAHNTRRDVIARPMTQRSHHFDLFVANAVSAKIRRRFHGRKAKELEQVVLYHVAQGACAFVIASASPNTQRFSRRDLHMIDVVRVPQRRENRVGKPENEDVLGGFLAEKMVDSIGLLFCKRIVDNAIELPR